jgi:hypothetical protein
LLIPSLNFPPIAFSTADSADWAKSFLAGGFFTGLFLTGFFIPSSVTNPARAVNAAGFQTIPVPIVNRESRFVIAFGPNHPTFVSPRFPFRHNETALNTET